MPTQCKKCMPEEYYTHPDCKMNLRTSIAYYHTHREEFVRKILAREEVYRRYEVEIVKKKEKIEDEE